MRAILIDAVEHSVREVEYDGQLESAYAMLRCDTIDIVRVGGGAAMIVDDEGLLTSDGDDSPFIVFSGGPIIAGSALLVGDADSEGNTTACPLALADIEAGTLFASRGTLKQCGIDPQPHMGFTILDDE